MYCKKCGTKLDEECLFCPECGYAVANNSGNKSNDQNEIMSQGTLNVDDTSNDQPEMISEKEINADESYLASPKTNLGQVNGSKINWFTNLPERSRVLIIFGLVFLALGIATYIAKIRYENTDSSVTIADFPDYEGYSTNQNNSTESGISIPATANETEVVADVNEDSEEAAGDSVIVDVEKTHIDSGILVARVSYGAPLYYNGTFQPAVLPFSLSLDYIDPETGETENFRTFSSMETHSCSISLMGSRLYINRTEQLFNSDFTKMTASLSMSDGAMHIGWIDEDGRFTDVSAAVSVSNSFGALTEHSGRGFYKDYIYFMDYTNGANELKRVNIHSLSPSSVEVIGDQYSIILPDGSVIDGGGWVHNFYDSSLSYTVPDSRFTDWISESECVGIYDDMLYKYILNPYDPNNSRNWCNEEIQLVPDVRGRKNYCGVVSPDCKKVAFLSYLSSGSDHSIHLFTVSVDGGDPIEIETTYEFPNYADDYKQGVDYVSILDWK